MTKTILQENEVKQEANARAQASLFLAREAIARWRVGNENPTLHIGAARRAGPQQRWYAQACEGFHAWLLQGGFRDGG
ncbi:MAG: hypothetical protein V4463_24350 [Pseudomonadota bacterium]